MVQKERGMRALEVEAEKAGEVKEGPQKPFPFFNCLSQLIYNLHFAERQF